MLLEMSWDHRGSGTGDRSGRPRRVLMLVTICAAALGVLGWAVAGATGVGAVGVPSVAQVFVVDANGQHLRQLTSGSMSHSTVQWLGSRAVAAVASGSSTNWIERHPLDGSSLTRLSPGVRGTIVFSRPAASPRSAA